MQPDKIAKSLYQENSNWQNLFIVTNLYTIQLKFYYKLIKYLYYLFDLKWYI